MAALGKASRILFPLAVAAVALALAIVSGREASRHIGGGAPSLEVLSSGLDQIEGFIGDLLYLKIDRYHHIWIYQGHEWQEATDYLPMVWLVSRLKPEYAQNYIDGGYHLAVNLKEVEEGVRFLRRGLRMCPDDEKLVWEYAIVLWTVRYGEPRDRQMAFWNYLEMVRRMRGRVDEPWNEHNAMMILADMFEEDSTRARHDLVARLYDRLYENRRRLGAMVRSSSGS